MNDAKTRPIGTIKSAHSYMGSLGPRVAIRYADDTEDDRPASDLEQRLLAGASVDADALRYAQSFVKAEDEDRNDIKDVRVSVSMRELVRLGCTTVSARPSCACMETYPQIIPGTVAHGPGCKATPGVGKRAIDRMVDRFLSWKLPEDFSPDSGITFKPPPHPNAWPIGTNLLNADQAKAMLLHVLGVTTDGRVEP